MNEIRLFFYHTIIFLTKSITKTKLKPNGSSVGLFKLSEGHLKQSFFFNFLVLKCGYNAPETNLGV